MARTKMFKENTPESRKLLTHLQKRHNAALSKLDSLGSLATSQTYAKYLAKLPETVFEALETELRKRMDKVFKDLRNPDTATGTVGIDLMALIGDDMDDLEELDEDKSAAA